MQQINYYNIEICHPLPFLPSNEQVIYIEKEYDQGVNRNIRKNYQKIVREFREKRLDFCYLPQYVEEVAGALMRYHNPSVTIDKVVSPSFTTADFVNVLFQGNVPQDLKPSLIVYLKYESTPEVARFLVVEFVQDTPLSTSHSFWRWFKKKSYNTGSEISLMASYLSHSLRDPNNQEPGVFYCERNWLLGPVAGSIMDEIVWRIHMLQNQGVDSMILKKMFSEIVDESRPLSRLVITKDWRIMLPDYNLEIKMEPINKAVYLLFLRHEEGIRIKELVDYQSELESLYAQFSHDDIEKRKATIAKLVDPTNNSVNEKLSRIRESFVCRFEDDLARHYYITGARGEAKRIELSRKLVSWI